MRSLELLIPPPLVAAITAALMWVATWIAPAADWQGRLSPVAQWGIIGVLVLSSATFALPALRQFKQLRTTTDPKRPHKARRLAATGVYAYSRNPMYLGVLLLLLAWAVFLLNGLSLLVAFFFPLYITIFQIRPEERYLEEKFGEEYLRYKAKVRRWG